MCIRNCHEKKNQFDAVQVQNRPNLFNEEKQQQLTKLTSHKNKT